MAHNRPAHALNAMQERVDAWEQADHLVASLSSLLTFSVGTADSADSDDHKRAGTQKQKYRHDATPEHKFA